MGDATSRRIAFRGSARGLHANGRSEPEAPAAEKAPGVGRRSSTRRTILVEKALLEAMTLPWVGQVVHCEALDDRSGIMIVVEGSDWLGRATLSWSMTDREDGRMEFTVGRRGLSQRESERDVLSRRESLRPRVEDE